MQNSFHYSHSSVEESKNSKFERSWRIFQLNVVLVVANQEIKFNLGFIPCLEASQLI